jgi:hypothetical protein
MAEQSNFSILEMEVDKDPIHLLVKSSPKISTLQIVRRLKQISTHRIWQSHPTELRKQFWKVHTFWSDGYFVCSIGNVSRETVKSIFKLKANPPFIRATEDCAVFWRSFYKIIFATAWPWTDGRFIRFYKRKIHLVSPCFLF